MKGERSSERRHHGDCVFYSHRIDRMMVCCGVWAGRSIAALSWMTSRYLGGFFGFESERVCQFHRNIRLLSANRSPPFYIANRSRREWSRWESSDIDEARRVRERERANQSKAKLMHVRKESQTRKSQQAFPAGIEPTFKV